MGISIGIVDGGMQHGGNEGYSCGQDAGGAALRTVDGSGQGFPPVVHHGDGIDTEVLVSVTVRVPRASPAGLVSVQREISAGDSAHRLDQTRIARPNVSAAAGPYMRSPFGPVWIRFFLMAVQKTPSGRGIAWRRKHQLVYRP